LRYNLDSMGPSPERAPDAHPKPPALPRTAAPSPPRAGGVPWSKVLVSLVPILFLMAVWSTVQFFLVKSDRSRLAAEKRGRQRALPSVERARELVERVEKYSRLPDPDEVRFDDLRGMAEEAVEAATEALSTYDRLEEAIRARGRALELLYNFEEARTSYEECIPLYSETPARYHLGLLGTRMLARARLAGMKTSLLPEEVLRTRATEPLRRFQAPSPEMSFTFDMKYRTLCTLCISYADGHYPSVPVNASAAAPFDETEWLVPYLEGLGHYELKAYEPALRSLDRAIRLMPAVADPHAWKGAVLHKLGRRAEAVAALSRALQASEHFLEAYYLRGTILFEDGRYADARSDFASCALLRPSLAEVQLKLGVASLEHWERTGRPPGKDLETAAAALTSYLESNPRDPQAYLLRARARLGLGLPEAEADLNQALSLAPDALDALSLRAMLHESRRRWAQAEKEYDAILEKATDPARAAETKRKRARVRAKGGRYKESLQDYDALLEKDPNDLGLFLEKAGLQFMAKDYDDALATTQKTFGRGPNAPRILALRAEIYLAKGEPQKAVEESTQAVAGDPELADALLTRGQALLKLGRRAEALADLVLALKKRPDLKETLDPLIAEAERN